jgi:thiamine pyrophosphokinase
MGYSELQINKINGRPLSTLMVCGSSKGISKTLLRKLGASSSQIFAIDSGANWLAAAGLSPDILIGDLDSIDASILAQIKQTDCRLITASSYKDVTDFDMALAEYACGLNDGQPAQLVICNVLGGRVDHELAALGSLAKALNKTPQIVAQIVEDDCKARILIGEDTLCLSALAKPGDTVSVIPLFESAKVSITGVEWELDHVVLPALDSYGVSNIVNTQDAQIVVHDGCVFVVVVTVPCAN